MRTDRKLSSLFFILILVLSCASPKKLLIKGQYDAAIVKAAKKIKKNPSKIKHIDVFTEAYRLANQQNLDRIEYLKKEGNPANYKEIYSLYERLKWRQDIAKSLPPIGIEFEWRDYDEELIAFKNKAVEYSYARGVQLMQQNTRQAAREAYAEFMNVKQLMPNYKDIDQKLNEARFLGTSNVLLKLENNSQMVLPKGFWEEVSKITTKDLNFEWVNFDNYPDTNKYYDYYAVLNINNIIIGPDLIKETPLTESKKVQDGFEYVLDEKGNVKKDSLGNDIKVPKYKTITCTVMRTEQKKAVTVSGNLEIYSSYDNQLLTRVPVKADAFFENYFSRVVSGDINALSDQTKKTLGGQLLPFPSTPDMIMRSTDILKDLTKKALYDNRHLFK